MNFANESVQLNASKLHSPKNDKIKADLPSAWSMAKPHVKSALMSNCAHEAYLHR